MISIPSCALLHKQQVRPLSKMKMEFALQVIQLILSIHDLELKPRGHIGEQIPHLACTHHSKLICKYEHPLSKKTLH